MATQTGRDSLPFVVQGTPESPQIVEASLVMEALTQGRNVELAFCTVVGKLALKGVHTSSRLSAGECSFQGDVELVRCVLDRRIEMFRCCFQRGVDLSHSRFAARAEFHCCAITGMLFCIGTVFEHSAEFNASDVTSLANFDDAAFQSRVLFLGTRFRSIASFERVIFAGAAYFQGAKFIDGASWDDVSFLGELSFGGATIAVSFNLPDAYWGDRPWWTRLAAHVGIGDPSPDTDVGEVIVSDCTSPLFRRWVDDTNYLCAWQAQHPVAHWLWLITSDCGRSVTLWMTWALGVAAAFGMLYARYPVWSWIPDPVARVLSAATCEFRIDTFPTWFTPYYTSVVTFTTLGFGDVTPLNLSAQIAVALEVSIGYVMLGALISLLGQKLARRS